MEISWNSQEQEYEVSGPDALRIVPDIRGFRPLARGFGLKTTDPFLVWPLLAKNPKIDGRTKTRLESERKRFEWNLEASVAATPPEEVSVALPEGRSLKDFQKVSILFSRKNSRKMLLADEMGLGKTIQAMAIANDMDAKKILVLSPSSMTWYWKNAVKNWHKDSLSAGIVGWDWKGKEDVTIVSYDAINEKRLKKLKKKYDLVILDEAHMIRNQGTHRHKAVMEIMSRNGKSGVVAITGTPIMNYYTDAWPLMHLLDSRRWPSLEHFCERFGISTQKRPGGRVQMEKEKAEEFRQIFAQYAVKRKKKDVMDLPSKILTVLPVETSSKKREDRKRLITTSLLGMLDLFGKMAGSPGNDPSGEERKEWKKELETRQRSYLNLVAKMKHDVAIEKIPATVDLVQNMVDQGRKVILFVHHKDVIRKYEDQFHGQSVTYTGSTSKEERKKAVAEFQNNPNTKVFIGSIRAAGQGLNLTKGSAVVFGELDWVPAIMEQAVDRCHRIGQDQDVVVAIPHIKGSVDDYVFGILSSKSAFSSMFSEVEHIDYDSAMAEKIQIAQSLSTVSGHRALPPIISGQDGSPMTIRAVFNGSDAECVVLKERYTDGNTLQAGEPGDILVRTDRETIIVDPVEFWEKAQEVRIQTQEQSEKSTASVRKKPGMGL